MAQENTQFYIPVVGPGPSQALLRFVLIETPEDSGLFTLTFEQSSLDGSTYPSRESGLSAAVNSIISSSASLASQFAYAMFYGLTAGTGNAAASDYAATVAVKTTAGTGRVPFPRLGPAAGGASAPVLGVALSNSFVLPDIATYEVTFRVHTTEPGQLQLELQGVDQPATVGVNMNPTAGGHPIIGNAFITTTVVNSVLAVVNCVGNAAALTITPADGNRTAANTQSLTIRKIG
jgi:hypothetical protein